MDPVVQAILANRLSAGFAAGHAVAEFCAGLWGRGFAAAVFDRPIPFDAEALAQLGRGMIDDGGAVFVMRGSGRAAEFVRASSFTPYGLERPEFYDVTLTGPTTSRVHRVGAGEVLHFRYATDTGNPWRGVSAAVKSAATMAVLDSVDRSLWEELRKIVAVIVRQPVRQRGQEPPATR